MRVFAQQPTSPERFVTPVRTDLPGRTVWAFATTGTGSAITTFAATDKGLYRSTGTSGAWSEVNALKNQEVFAVKARRVGNNATLLAATKKGILRSQDGGTTWASPEVTTGTVVSTSNILELKKVFDIEIVNSTWYAATEKGVFRSTNDGRSWTLLNIDRSVDNNEVRGITAEGNTIIVNLWKEGLWRSTNNGGSWAKLTITGESALVRAVFGFPTTTGTMWLAGSVAGNIWRSVNNGGAWTRVYQGASTARSSSSAEKGATTMGVDALAGGTLTGYRGRQLYALFGTTPGGILFSLDHGQTWERTRTLNTQAQSLIVVGNKVFVGDDSPSSSLVLNKETGSSSHNTNNGNYQYDATCGNNAELDRSSCSGGGGGGTGGGGTGGSTGGQYTIISKAPRITSLTPSSFPPTASQSLGIGGENFALSLSPDPGFDIPDAFVMADSNAPFSQQYFLPRTSYSNFSYNTTIGAGQANVPGTYYVRVVTFFGETWSRSFTVTPLAPALSSISPNTATAGQSVTITATGNNFGTAGELRQNGNVISGITYNTPRNATTVIGTFPAPQTGTYNISVFANGQNSNTQTLTVSNPTPTISGIATNPTTPFATQSVSVALTGTNFLPGASQVTLTGPSGAVSISANVQPTNTTFSFTPSLSGSYTVTVTNPGVAQTASSSFTVGTPPPVPVLSSVSIDGADAVDAGVGQKTLIVNGSNFQNNSVVRLNGMDMATTFLSASQLSAQIPATNFTTPNQTLLVRVFTPPASNSAGSVGGGLSAAEGRLYVLYPQPTFTSVTPTFLPARTLSPVLTVNGSGFYTATTLVWDSTGSGRFEWGFPAGVANNAPSAMLNLSPALTSQPRVVQLALRNPGYVDGARSFPARIATTLVPFTVSNIRPILTGIDPAQRLIVWTGTPFTRTIVFNGDNFLTATRLVVVNDNNRELPRADMSYSPMTMNASLNVNGLGTFILRAKNPSPDGIIANDLLSDASDTVRVVNPAPSVGSVPASSFPVNTVPASITINGSLFMDGITATVAGRAATLTRNSANSITLTFTPDILQHFQMSGAGQYHVVLTNPAPSQGLAHFILTVQNPPLTGFTLSPSSAVIQPNVNQTVILTAAQGSAFASNATVSFNNQAVSQGFITRPSATQLQVQLFYTLVQTAGTFPITVSQSNAAPSGNPASAIAQLQLFNPVPVLQSVVSTPSPILMNGADASIRLQGSLFMPGAIVRFRGQSLTTSNLSNNFVPNSVDATIPAALLDSAGVFPISITNTQTQGNGTATNQPTVTVIAPRPRLTSLSPATMVINSNNGQDVTISLFGSGFVRGSRLAWNIDGAQTLLATTYQNTNSLTVSLPANLLQAPVRVVRLAVVNDAFSGQGGGVSDTLQFALTNPAPSITLQQALPNATRFASQHVLNFTGTNFMPGARVLVTGVNGVVDTLTANVFTQTSLQAILPASLLDTATQLTIRLLNPAPSQGASNSVTMLVLNPRPRLSSLSQTTVLTGGSSLTVTASGQDFMDGVTAFASGTPIGISRTNQNSLTLTIPQASLAQAGVLRIAVQNPQPRQTPDFSDSLTITVENPLPRLDSAATNPLVVSTQATTITLFGNNFILASSVKENGGGRTESTLVSNRLTQETISATVPATMTAQAGTVRLAVVNPLPGGGRSQEFTMNVVNPAPMLERITPSVVVQSANPLPLTLTGDRFVNGAEVLVNGTAVPTQITPTRLTATIPAAMIQGRGFYAVSVRNPQTNGTNGIPDGGTSAVQLLRVNTPQPLVNTLNLSQVPLDTVDVPLIITGSRFLDSAIVRITAPNNVTVSVATTSISATTITALIPASVLNRGGIYTVVVENPAPTDIPSQAKTFAVVNPVPVVDSIAPRSVQPSANSANTVITVFGKLFTPTSVVRWRGQDLTTTFVSRTSLTATLPQTAQTLGAVGAVTVFTPTDGVLFMGNPVGGGTGSIAGALGTLLVSHAVPSLTALTQTTVVRDAWGTQALPTFSMTGEYFASNATVRLLTADSTQGSPTVNTTLNFTAQTATSLAVQLPSVLMPKTGVVRVRVQNQAAFAPSGLFASWLAVPDGGVSTERTFTMVNPAPTLSSITPTSVAAAAQGNLALSLTGTNFIPESVLLVNGRVWTRTVASAAAMSASLPDSLFTLSGYVRLQVVNPAPLASGNLADSSNVLQLEIFNPVPTLAAIVPVFTPIAGRAATDSVSITLVGTNFVRNSQIRMVSTVAGSPLVDIPTRYRSRDTLVARMLAADFRAGAFNMSVLNPAPRGGSSVARRFTVTAPVPILTALLPASTSFTGSPWTLTLTGRFFTAQSQVSYRNALQSLANTTYIPGTNAPIATDTLRVRLAAVPVGDTTFPVAVYNPPTGGVGGGVSDTLRLAVGLPAPVITTISPASSAVSLGVQGRAVLLTVNGTGFDNDAKIFLKHASAPSVELPTTFVSTTRLTALLPDSLQRTQGVRSVQVRNTPVLMSNLVNLTLVNPAPVLTSIDPTSIIAGRDTTLLLTGDRFAPEAVVRLIFGNTTTVLTPTRRDSVIGLLVRLPDSLTRTMGAYSLRVVNPPLVVDTTSTGGGQSAVQTLTVVNDRVFSATFTGVDTLLNAGDRMPFITVRFRDRNGNLVDNATTISFTNTDASAAGIFTQTRTSLGTYRLDTLSFSVAGNYNINIDTSATGALQTIGANRFTVLTRGAVRLELTGLQTTLQAGDSLPRWSLKYFDTQNNLTDGNVRPVIVTATVQGVAYRDTLALVRTSTGLYDVPAQLYTGAAVYTITPLGIAAANITGDRLFTVLPRPAHSVQFTSLTPSVISGGLQSRFRATLRDAFQNLTDAVQTDSTTIVQPTQAYFSMSTDATFDDSTRQARAGFFPLSRTSLGVFTADTVRFQEAGKFSVGIMGVGSTSGTAAFSVRPNVDFRVVFENVPDTLVAGDSLRNITIRYFDRSDNPTDNGIGRVVYARSGGSSTATVAMSRVATGVYALASTQATLAGTYNFSVSGITSVNMEGNRRFEVIPSTAPATVTMLISTTAMTSRGSNVSFSLTYRDDFNNLVDWASTLSINNPEVSSSATFTLQRISKGIYKKTVVVLEPGGYDVTLDTAPPDLEIIGPNTFGCSPGKAVRVRFSNILGTITAGNSVDSAFVTLYDVRGRTTNNLTNILTLSTRGVEQREPIAFTQRDSLVVQHSGVFDIEQLTFTKVGTNTFRVDSDVDGLLPWQGNNALTILPAQVVTAQVSFANAPLNPDSTATAGTTLPLTVIFRDRFDNPASPLNPLLMAGTGATLSIANPLGTTLARRLTRTVVAGVPVFTTNITPATSGTYRFAIDTLQPNTVIAAVNGRTSFTVVAGAPRSVELLLSAPSVPMNTGELCATFIFRDPSGNLTEPNLALGQTFSATYTAGAISSTATVPLLPPMRLSTGFYQACGLRFAQANINAAHVYTISVPGFTGGNLRGQRTFQVLNPVPVLSSINPGRFLVDSCGNSGLVIMELDKGGASSSHSLSNSAPVPGVAPSRTAGEEMPSAFTLFPPAPNPFVSTTKLRYELAADAHIRLNIFDMNGNQISEIASVEQKSGYYELEWMPPAELPSGTYIIVLTARTAKGQVLQRGTAVQRVK